MRPQDRSKQDVTIAPNHVEHDPINGKEERLKAI
jgi:hypothetical protein